MTEAQHISQCRSCGSADLTTFLDLGETPIANNLRPLGSDPSTEETFPLVVGFCSECSLVQLRYVLPADVIFGEAYPYYSSFSDDMVQHAKLHAESLLASRNLTENSLVVEVASNDGYLLKNFVAAGVPVLGIDPAPGPAAAAVADNVETLVAFFGVDLAEKLVAEGKRADVIIANNVMAHVPDLNDFVGGFARLIADDGVITIENPYVRQMITNVEYDTVYHEHYYYYSCTAVQALMARHGLYLNHVEFLPNMHGGSCRWYVSKRAGLSKDALRFLAEEQSAGMHQLGYYETFGARVDEANLALKALLIELVQGGAVVAAYGAAAKGCTLLNSAKIDSTLVQYVIDRNVHKQNHLLPGINIAIVEPAQIAERKPDYLLLLAWNFATEIIAQQQAFLAAGGRFIVPLPRPRIVSAEG
jgi:SAM-dependent methyltransferase